MAEDFKDELVPMAFEYYLNVVEHGDPFNQNHIAKDKDGENKNEE